jgi:hypothetical protein
VDLFATTGYGAGVRRIAPKGHIVPDSSRWEFWQYAQDRVEPA